MNKISQSLSDNDLILDHLNKLKENLTHSNLPTIKLEEIVKDTLTPLIEEFNKNIDKKWPKRFVKWLNTPHIGLNSAGQIGEIDQIAKHLIGLEKHILEEIFNALPLSIGIQPANLKKGDFKIKNGFWEKLEKVQKIEPSIIQAVVKKNYQEIQKICRDIALLQQNGPQAGLSHEIIKELCEDLQVRALHFLVRGAKIPIFDDRKGKVCSLHLSFLELWKSNITDYYRGDGGFAIDIFETHLKDIINNQDIQGEGFAIHILKNGSFHSLIENVCESAGVQYEHTTDWNELTLLNQSTPVDRFIDITRLLDIQQLNRIPESQEHICIGGLIQYKGQDVLLIKKSMHEIKIREKTFIEMLGEFQNSQGYNPEIVTIKRSLVKAGLEIEAVLNLFSKIGFKPETLNIAPPLPLSTQIGDIHHLLHQVQDHLIELRKTDKIFGCYIELIQNMIDHLSKNGLKNELVLSLVNNELKRIDKKILRIKERAQSHESPQIKFQNCLQDYYLIFENIDYLMIFTSLQNPIKDLRLTLQELSPIQELLLGESIKNSYTFTSGMSCFVQIASFLKKVFPKEQIQIAFTQGSYYELTKEEGGFSTFVKKTFSTTQADDLESFPFDTKDVLFMDIYPNFVTLDEVKKIPIAQLITQALEKRRPSSSPLAVVIDTATTFLTDPEISTLIEQQREAIDKGELIVITTVSLAKFAMCGLDKYTGGVVQVFCAKTYEKSLNQTLKAESDEDPFSKEAKLFFSILLEDQAKHVKNYIQLIKNSTDKFYHLLKKELKSNYIQLGQKDDLIPMIGIKFDPIIRSDLLAQHSETQLKENMTYLMQGYLYAKAAKDDLPYSIRSSFGFPNATCIECETALRLTIGLEPEEILVSYVKLFNSAEEEIDEFLRQNIAGLDEFLTSDDLSSIIEEHELELVKESQGTFKSYLEILKTKL